MFVGAYNGRGVHPKSEVSPKNLGLVAGVQPLRRPNRKLSRSSFHGVFSATKALGPAPFESLLERDFLTLLEVDTEIFRYAVQPHCLTYWGPDRTGRLMKRTYTPDVVAQTRTGKPLVIDVKASAFAKAPSWQRLSAHIRYAYKVDHGVDFHVVTEEAVRSQPRLANSQLIYHFSRRGEDERGDRAVQKVLSNSGGQCTLGDLTQALGPVEGDEQHAYAAAMRLIRLGVVQVSMNEPLGMQTVVTGDPQ